MQSSMPSMPGGFELSTTSVRARTSMRAPTTSVGPTSMDVGSTGCGLPGSSALETRGWATGSVPVWRHCQHGLCIEGFCHNPQCVANGKKVICSLSYTTLDLVAPQGRCKCPCCKSTITPANAAFNNCEWTLSGVKVDYPGAAPETVRLEWEAVGNTYSCFKEDPEDKSTWIRLCITTRKPSTTAPEPSNVNLGSIIQTLKPQPTTSTSNQVVCSICCGEPFSRFGSTAINTPCGHCYHRECLKPWLQRDRRDCPTCRRDISCLAPELLK